MSSVTRSLCLVTRLRLHSFPVFFRCLRMSSRLAAAPVTGGRAAAAEASRRARATALSGAEDGVIRGRSHSAGRIKGLAELAGVLNSGAPRVEGAVAVGRSGAPAAPVDVAAVEAI